MIKSFSLSPSFEPSTFFLLRLPGCLAALEPCCSLFFWLVSYLSSHLIYFIRFSFSKSKYQSFNNTRFIYLRETNQRKHDETRSKINRKVNVKILFRQKRDEKIIEKEFWRERDEKYLFPRDIFGSMIQETIFFSLSIYLFCERKFFFRNN